MIFEGVTPTQPNTRKGGGEIKPRFATAPDLNFQELGPKLQTLEISFSVLRKQFWNNFSSQAPKGYNFQAFSTFATKIAPDSCEKLIFNHFQLKT